MPVIGQGMFVLWKTMKMFEYMNNLILNLKIIKFLGASIKMATRNIDKNKNSKDI